MSEMQLIVGLGNPGHDYEYMRHNLGFLVVRKLSERIDFKLKLSSFTNGLTAEGEYEGKNLCLLMPLTYMNNSGRAINHIWEAKDIALGNMLVVCDDLNLGFGQLRLKPKGGHGGHNGLKSVINAVQGEEFSRLRMGIDFPRNSDIIVDYVLSEFSKKEKEGLKYFIDEAVDCCLSWLKKGVVSTMDIYNQRKVREDNGK